MVKLLVLGRKYCLRLLASLENKPLRFKELRKSVPNEKTLGTRLREFQQLGVVEPVIIEKVGRPHHVYRLTTKGSKLLPLLVRIKKL